MAREVVSASTLYHPEEVSVMHAKVGSHWHREPTRGSFTPESRPRLQHNPPACLVEKQDTSCFFLCLCPEACGISIPQAGTEPGPWE